MGQDSTWSYKHTHHLQSISDRTTQNLSKTNAAWFMHHHISTIEETPQEACENVPFPFRHFNFFACYIKSNEIFFTLTKSITSQINLSSILFYMSSKSHVGLKWKEKMKMRLSMDLEKKICCKENDVTVNTVYGKTYTEWNGFEKGLMEYEYELSRFTSQYIFFTQFFALCFVLSCLSYLETFSVLLAICPGNSPVPGEIPA